MNEWKIGHVTFELAGLVPNKQIGFEERQTMERMDSFREKRRSHISMDEEMLPPKTADVF